MILVDSSVWIDYFNGVESPQCRTLDALIGVELLAIGDLILVEVLQGFQTDRDFKKAKALLTTLPIVQLCGERVATQAARNYRKMRDLGITVRKTINTIIATWCIEHSAVLLHSDRDFNPLAKHLGLKVLEAGVY